MLHVRTVLKSGVKADAMLSVRLLKSAVLLATILLVTTLVAGTAHAGSTCSVTIKAGKLTMQTPQVGEIASMPVDGSAKSSTVPMTALTITDATGTGAGWQVTVQATPLASRGCTLISGSLMMACAELANSNKWSEACPELACAACPIDAQRAVLIADAAPGGSGMGAFHATEPGSLTVNVPADVEAGYYSSILFLSLITGP